MRMGTLLTVQVTNDMSPSHVDTLLSGHGQCRWNAVQGNHCHCDQHYTVKGNQCVCASDHCQKVTNGNINPEIMKVITSLVTAEVAKQSSRQSTIERQQSSRKLLSTIQSMLGTSKQHAACKNAVAALVKKEQIDADHVARELCHVASGHRSLSDVERLLAPQGPALQRDDSTRLGASMELQQGVNREEGSNANSADGTQDSNDMEVKKQAAAETAATDAAAGSLPGITAPRRHRLSEWAKQGTKPVSDLSPAENFVLSLVSQKSDFSGNNDVSVKCSKGKLQMAAAQCEAVQGCEWDGQRCIDAVVWQCGVNKKVLDCKVIRIMAPTELAAPTDQLCGRLLLGQEKETFRVCNGGVRISMKCETDADCAVPGELGEVSDIGLFSNISSTLKHPRCKTYRRYRGCAREARHTCTSKGVDKISVMAT